VTKYSTEILSNFRSKEKKIKVVLDEEVMNSWDGTFFCFGSSDSNIKTYDVENLPQNNLYSFGFDSTGFRCFIINGKQFSISNRKDKAVLARFVNPHHNEHYIFVCAGLGEWGTSGATYFLFDRWKDLYKRFKKNQNFCLILEVDLQADDSAKEIYCNVI